MKNNFEFIDIHYHASPDLYLRRHSALEAGRLYKEKRGAVVLKSHLGSTAAAATLAQKEGLPVFGSVVLNRIAGGLDFRVVLQALSEYQGENDVRLIVDFPTLTGRAYTSKLSREFANPRMSELAFEAETIFNSDGKLKPSVVDILKMSRDWPIVLTSGHASKDETYALVEACDTHRVPRLLLNQPANPQTALSATQLKQFDLDFLFVEQTALTRVIGHQSEDDFFDVLRHVPNAVYSSDFGQTSQMDIGEWLSFTTDVFDKCGIKDSRRHELVLTNAARMLSY